MNRFLMLLACSAAFTLSPSHSYATEEQAQELQISRAGDLEMSCGQLSREASLMRDIISVTRDIQDDKEFNNHGISAAAGVGSFLLGSATGGIGFAAAGLLAKEINNNSKEEVESVEDRAAQRRTFIIGIYNAKGCSGPIEHAMQDIELEFPEDEDYDMDGRDGRDGRDVAVIETAAGADHDDPPRLNAQRHAAAMHLNQ